MGEPELGPRAYPACWTVSYDPESIGSMRNLDPGVYHFDNEEGATLLYEGVAARGVGVSLYYRPAYTIPPTILMRKRGKR